MTEEKLLDAERKGAQLCNAVGVMMLACKRLRSLQEQHALQHHPATHQWCEACKIPLPDLSAEGVEKLANESNESFAELLAAAEARGAEREREWLIPLLREAVGVLVGHHDSRLCTWGGSCPVCPADIFHRIGAAIRADSLTPVAEAEEEYPR